MFSFLVGYFLNFLVCFSKWSFKISSLTDPLSPPRNCWYFYWIVFRLSLNREGKDVFSSFHPGTLHNFDLFKSSLRSLGSILKFSSHRHYIFIKSVPSRFIFHCYWNNRCSCFTPLTAMVGVESREVGALPPAAGSRPSWRSGRRSSRLSHAASLPEVHLSMHSWIKEIYYWLVLTKPWEQECAFGYRLRLLINMPTSHIRVHGIHTQFPANADLRREQWWVK